MGVIRDFIEDNIRYVISGILLIFIVLILVKCTGEPEQEAAEEPEESGIVASEDEQQIIEAEPVNELVKDAYPDVNALIQSYYAACADGDVDKVRELVNVLEDSEAQSIAKMAEHIESYNSIECYTKNGPETGSQVAYVCYEIKFVNVETMAPSLNMLYVRAAADGSLYIDKGSWDAQTEAVIGEMNQGDDIQALVARIEVSYAEALAQDEKLSDLAATIQSATNEEQEAPEETESAEAEPEQPEGETVYAVETVNVRGQASETAERVGQIARGDSAIRISEDNGWSQIKYNNATAYVKSEFVTVNRDDLNTNTPADSPSSGKARITESAKVRTGEAKDSQYIETLYEGTEVEVLEKLASGRTKISYNGKTGYVNSECVGR